MNYYFSVYEPKNNAKLDFHNIYEMIKICFPTLNIESFKYFLQDIFIRNNKIETFVQVIEKRIKNIKFI